MGRKRGIVDVTGLEVATCHHQSGQKTVSMKYGKLYGYALYFIRYQIIPGKVKLVFAAVMCKLWKFLKRVEPEMSNQIKGALSVMHAKGHSLECQVNRN